MIILLIRLPPAEKISYLVVSDRGIKNACLCFFPFSSASELWFGIPKCFNQGAPPPGPPPCRGRPRVHAFRLLVNPCENQEIKKSQKARKSGRKEIR
jgi:hypothetical protein